MSLLNLLQKTDKDAQLMLAYAKGNASAFEELYGRFKGPLYRYFLRQCGSRAIAEELYQELWLRVINARENYQPKAKFSTWIYRIAHNLLIDHFRKPELECDADEQEQNPPKIDNDPATIFAGQEKIQQYRAQLRSLPKEQQEVFLLKQEAGFSLNEIATLTGESFETVKSRLRYSVNKLKHSLSNLE